MRLSAGLAALGLSVAVVLAGCAPPQMMPRAAVARLPLAPLSEAAMAADMAAASFVAVVQAVEPVAEAMCRARTAGVSCDFQIVVDDRPGQPPNAFQTLDRAGRPVLGFTLALIADARNADEIAFVIGHEAAHHLLGHLPMQRQSAAAGALVAGIMAQASGAGPAEIRAAQDLGATVGARTYSKDFELEADALGTEITMLAGFDAVRGAGFFDRLPDPGDRFLGSHPPNAQRRAVVRRAAAMMR